MKKKRKKFGEIQRKILIALLAGVALAGTRSSSKHWRIIKETYKAFTEKDVAIQNVERAINSLLQARLVEEKYNRKGSTTLLLTHKGKIQALSFNIENIKISTPKTWDKRWRIVMYDIPRRSNRVREVLRYNFKRLGMIELQHSVFIHPYDCHKEIKYIAEFHHAYKYIRFVIAEYIDNHDFLSKQFSLF